MLSCFTTSSVVTTPITPIVESEFQHWLSQQSPRIKNTVAAIGFHAKSGSTALLCSTEGQLENVLFGIKDHGEMQIFGHLSTTLPKGVYQIHGLPAHAYYQAALSWGMGCYQFALYKKMPTLEAQLLLADQEMANAVERLISATYLVRDLINTPTEAMGPTQLAEAAIKLARQFDGRVKQTVGIDLVKEGYNTIHAVGRASAQEPRLIELRWGDISHPKVTLVGKGVCFDSGGLNLKNASGMALMKKDMAGAAIALGLAQLIMASNLPVSLRVLLPAAENAVSGNAYRPGDVITTKKGISVEITNTDAEGRLVLCDGLTAAVEEKPELIFDFATLTGAARIAVGTEVSALFSNNDALANALQQAGEKEHDPIWRLPLYAPYRKMLDSKIADLVNASSSGYAGAITAALFLKEFVPNDIPWAHFDTMAWNLHSKPAHPEGGEAMTLRAVFRYLQERFASNSARN